MININRVISSDENEIYRLNKKIWLIPFMFIFCPLWLLFGLIFLVPCFNNLFMGSISFEADASYIFSIISLIIFIPMAVLLPVSYAMNQLLVTDKRIFIRKGLSGKLYVINISDISAYHHITTTSKGYTSHFIHFYLKCGKRIKSGNLFVKDDSLSELLGILSNKINNKITSRKQIKEYKLNGLDYCSVITKRNFIFPIISLAPFILALIMFILYIGGVNKMGVQSNVQVYGTVDEKKINYNKKHEISGYEFKVKEDNNNQKLTVPVNEKIFNMFKEREKVLIKGKKGSLGLIYAQWFYKQ